MAELKYSINELILFSIYTLNKNKQSPDFSDLIKECFSNFPEVFSLKRYSQWPDARKLDRPLRDLRKKKLVAGGAEGLLRLTNKGKKAGAAVAKRLGQQKLL